MTLITNTNQIRLVLDNINVNNMNKRNYNITKYKGNTHYQVYVTDSYGREKGNFFTELQECYDFVYKVWEQEQPLTDKEVKQKLLNSAILNCIRLEEKNNN